MLEARCLALFAALAVAKVVSDNCYVRWMDSGHEVVDSKFEIDLAVVNALGPLYTYFPSTNYEIKIRGKTRDQTFTHFYFMMSNLNKSKSAGSMYIREKDISRFHNERFCVNKIVDGPISLLKYNISIGWQSPPEDSGCIKMVVYVKETDLRYHKANLTVCQDPRVKLDDQGEVLKNCSACAVAKYELGFEGLWTKYYHPRHYPAVELTAFFPTVLGASHDPVYEFWHPYTMASDGLKQFAWSGQTKALEVEIKKNRRSIASLIKFQGSNFQNTSRRSYAYLTVTNLKHVVSLVSRLSPSPDWFVGVSSLELCSSEGDWTKQKSLNLYAYDAGVRDGLLYEDIEDETEPQLEIRSMNVTYPRPSAAGVVPPFYDSLNNTHNARPLARLHFNLIRDSCAKSDESDKCFTEYSEWGPCLGECGMGFRNRTRRVKDDFAQDKSCAARESSKWSNATDVPPDPRLFQREPCKLLVECPKVLSVEDCELEAWGPWSRCSKNCGQEVTKRERKYKWASFERGCADKFGPQRLEEKLDCGNPPCPDDEYTCADCRYTEWKDWIPCSVTLGVGITFRYRELQDSYKRVDVACDPQKRDYGYSLCLFEKKRCNGSLHELAAAPTDEDDNPVQLPASARSSSSELGRTALDVCALPVEEGDCDDSSHRYYYDRTVDACKTFVYSGCKGNGNNFKTDKDCEERCRPPGPKLNCRLSELCERCSRCGETVPCRYVVEAYAKNGGRPCAPSYRSYRDCNKVLAWCG